MDYKELIRNSNPNKLVIIENIVDKIKIDPSLTPTAKIDLYNEVIKKYVQAYENRGCHYTTLCLGISHSIH